MTVVLVHGNPETDAVWGPLADALRRDDVVRLSPPGFGAPVPRGWGATVEEYRLWLVGELEAVGEPVDLVGHDWGGGHVANVAMTRPDLLRSWCSDILGVFEPDYVWHDMAQVWQTPLQSGPWPFDDREPWLRACEPAPRAVTAAQARQVAKSADAIRLSEFRWLSWRWRVTDTIDDHGLFDANGYNVWNAGASWRVSRRIEVFGRIENLFDRQYEEVFGFPALGRGAMAGLRIAASR